MVFSTNQNRQIFVLKDEAAEKELAQLMTAKAGEAYKVGGSKADGFYLITKGHGGPVKSDFIKHVMWATLTAPEDMAQKLQSVKLTLDPQVNCGEVVASEDYVLRIVFAHGMGFSDEDTYIKNAAVRGYSDMTAADFYTEMAASLVRNFSKVYSPLIEVSNGDAVAVRAGKKDGKTALFDAEGNQVEFSDAIYLNEMSQVSEWALGTKQLQKVSFQVIPTTIKVDGEDRVWGVVEDNTEAYDTVVDNGYMIADLEYFCMGERADQYRNVGWPKVIPTKYLVDPELKYYCLDIHFAYQGTCEDIQKSEKTITVVSPNKSALEAIVSSMELEDHPCYKKSPNA